MISLIGVSDAEKQVADYMRQHRVALGFTQAALATRAGVNLFTLRKFEQKGVISFESLLKMALVLGLLEKIIASIKPTQPEFLTIDDVIAAQKKPSRKRGRRA